MRLLGLPALLLLLVLAGCGEETAERTDTADPTPSTPLESDPAPPVRPQVVDLLSGTAVGGQVQGVLTRVDQDPLAFLDQFERPEFAEEVRVSIQAAAAPTGEVWAGEVWAGVVALGCDVPEEVVVTAEEGGYLAEARPVAKPLQECFAPVTTVAVVTAG